MASLLAVLVLGNKVDGSVRTMDSSVVMMELTTVTAVLRSVASTSTALLDELLRGKGMIVEEG